jgi:phage-related protein
MKISSGQQFAHPVFYPLATLHTAATGAVPVATAMVLVVQVAAALIAAPVFLIINCCPFGLLLYFCKVSEINKYRTIITYKHYFEEFLIKQRQKVKEKIVWTFLLIEEVQQVPETYLKHLEGTDGLYEIRIQLASDIFRIFCFFDEGKLVVLANAFQKKTQKTPRQEIAKALKIKEEYYESKK